MKPVAPVRPSPIAGTWYEGHPSKLASEVDRYIHEASLPDFDGEVVALIAPHAGYLYSGPVAGYAFATVHGMDFDLVAVISPMHAYYREPILTSSHEAYSTPLGKISIDRAAVEAVDTLLCADIGVGLKPIANDSEHSLEIELPFLQRTLNGEFNLLPIMISEQTNRIAYTLGTALAKILRGRNALLVGSTDLSHFKSRDAANKFDQEMLRQVERFSPEGLLKAEENGKGFACGRGAVATVLYAAKSLGADTVKILNYATSGDITGDYDSVVGYGAAVVLKSNQQN